VKTKKFENALAEADYFSKLTKEDSLKSCVFVEEFVKTKNYDSYLSRQSAKSKIKNLLPVKGVNQQKRSAVSRIPKPKQTNCSSSDSKTFVVKKSVSAELYMKKKMGLLSPNQTMFKLKINKKDNDCSKTTNTIRKDTLLREESAPLNIEKRRNKKILQLENNQKEGSPDVSELPMDDSVESEQDALKELEIIEKMLSSVQHVPINDTGT